MIRTLILASAFQAIAFGAKIEAFSPYWWVFSVGAVAISLLIVDK